METDIHPNNLTPLSTAPAADSPLPLQTPPQPKKTRFLIIIIIVTALVLFLLLIGVLVARHFFTTRTSDSPTTPILTLSKPSETEPPVTSESNSTTSAISNKRQSNTCSDAQSYYIDANKAFPEVSIKIINSKTKGECQLTTDYGVTFLFNEGEMVNLFGAMGQSLGFFSNNSDAADIIFSSYELAENSPVDLTQIEKIIISGHGVSPYITDSYKILKSSINTIGTNKVNVLTLKVNYNGTYERRYVLLDVSNKILFEFTMFSTTNDFEKEENKILLNNINKIVGSFKYIPVPAK